MNCAPKSNITDLCTASIINDPNHALPKNCSGNSNKSDVRSSLKYAFLSENLFEDFVQSYDKNSAFLQTWLLTHTLITKH